MIMKKSHRKLLKEQLINLLNNRRFSKLYVEIYQKPTGFHSIEEMKNDILKKDKQIYDLKESVEDFEELLAKDKKVLELEALYYYCIKFPLIQNYLSQEAKQILSIHFNLCQNNS